MEKEKEIKITAIQMESLIGNKQANFDKVEQLVEKHLDLETDILVLPEVWNVGWDCSYFKKSAENINNSPTINLLKKIAIKYNVNLIGGSFIEEKNINNEIKYFNTCPVIDRQGEIICAYNKNHLFSYYDDSENSVITKGNNPKIVTIDKVKFGLSICYDIRFPEIYRAYRKAGADVLINLAAWPSSRAIHWNALTQARAVENQSYMIALTQTGTLLTGEKNLGHSLVYDYSGNILDEINNSEGSISAILNINKMYEFRDKCTILKDIQDKYEVICN